MVSLTVTGKESRLIDNAATAKIVFVMKLEWDILGATCFVTRFWLIHFDLSPHKECKIYTNCTEIDCVHDK